MTWLTFLWTYRKYVAIGLFLVAYGWAVWHAHGIYDDHLNLTKLKAAEQRTELLQAKINSSSAAYEAERAQSAYALLSAQQQLKAYHAKHDNRATCPVSADVLPLLNR